ncbi:hypothetical protein [Bordetella genomosp. 1]|uniref:Uncharacterized protein n=1 Tax=Bordetella genomosp. 1 TaxID=1395607 RepID=A0ABX4EW79_9BORD|nr:hypothetical protein [Bordetella genomosp. 1]OZI58736.1 hypothetical protein CAL27_18820 [Bordetella genomosp. 1]
MTTKHTPGPWEADGEYVQQVGQTEVGICAVLNMDEGGSKGWYPGETTRANARLIAAAPDLLEALRAVVRVADRATDEFDLARAAILKATGEQA